MASQLTPYINFKNTAKEAQEFYKSIFGGELTFSTFGEYGMADDPAQAGLIMHSQLETPSGYVIMASDTPDHMEFTPGTNHSLSLSGGSEDAEELTGYWNGLSEGAEIREPLVQAPWGDTFGMLKDRFGVQWLVNIQGAKQQ